MSIPNNKIQDRYKEITTYLDQIVTKQKFVKPLIDTSIPFVKDSQYLLYVVRSFFSYKKLKVSDISEETKTQMLETYQHNLKALKNQLTQFKAKANEVSSLEKAYRKELKTYSKEDDAKAQILLDKIQKNSIDQNMLNSRIANTESLQRAYAKKINKLKSNDPKHIEYIADAQFIKMLLKETFNIEKSKEIIDQAISDVQKLVSKAKETKTDLPIVIYESICYNKAYRDLIANLETYSDTIKYFICIEIIHDYMSDEKMVLTDALGDKYWAIPEVEDILDEDQLNTYIQFIEEKYNKVLTYFETRPFYFTKNDIKSITSLLRYVYTMVLSKTSAVIMLQSMEDVKNTPASEFEANMIKSIYYDLITKMSETLFKDVEEPTEDFFRVYILITLLILTNPEDLLNRIEAM